MSNVPQARKRRREEKWLSGAAAVRQVMKRLGISKKQAQRLLIEAVERGELRAFDHTGDTLAADEINFEEFH
jgi:hypothetical protein